MPKTDHQRIVMIALVHFDCATVLDAQKIIAERTAHRFSVSQLYVVLERLRVTTHVDSEKRTRRDVRGRLHEQRFYWLTAAGKAALINALARADIDAMTVGLDLDAIQQSAAASTVSKRSRAAVSRPKNPSGADSAMH